MKKKIISLINISLVFFALVFDANSEEYFKLNSIQNFVFGKKKIDLVCYDTLGETGQKNSVVRYYTIDFENKHVKHFFLPLSESNIPFKFDVSSNDNFLRFFNVYNSYSFVTLDLNNLIMEEKYLKNMDLANLPKDFQRLFDDNKTFELLKTDKIKKTYKFNCSIQFGRILQEKAESFYEDLLKEMNVMTKIKICKGKHKFGPDDPSIFWNDCIAIKKLDGDGSEYYVGRFYDGNFDDKGIYFFIGWPYLASYIAITKYKDDEIIDGDVTIIREADISEKSLKDERRRKSWIHVQIFENGEFSSQKNYEELKLIN